MPKYDYSRLPTLVLNEIFGYLSVKERIKCKPVCRAWKSRSRAKKARDVLILHLDPSFKEFTIVEERSSHVLDIDLSFRHLLDLACMQLASTRLPRDCQRFVDHLAARAN